MSFEPEIVSPDMPQTVGADLDCDRDFWKIDKRKKPCFLNLTLAANGHPSFLPTLLPYWLEARLPSKETSAIFRMPPAIRPDGINSGKTRR
jgi:hypothetical protein